MSEILQRVRTEFRASATGIEADLQRAGRSADAAGLSLDRVQQKVDKLAKSTSRTFEIKVQSGSINTSPLSKTGFGDIDGDLLGKANRAAFDDRKRFADAWMVDELERMRAVRNAARSTGGEVSSFGDRAARMRSGIREGLRGVDEMRGSFMFLRENLALFTLGIPGVIAGIVAITDKLGGAGAATREWAKNVGDIRQELAFVQNFLRDERGKRDPNRLPEPPRVTELKAAQKTIVGTPGDGGEDGNKGAGSWQLVKQFEDLARARLDEVARRAWQLQVGPAVRTKTGEMIRGVTGAERRDVLQQLESSVLNLELITQRRLALERELRTNLDGQSSALWDQVTAAADLEGRARSIMNIGASVVTTFDNAISGIGDAIVEGVKRLPTPKSAKQEKEEFADTLSKLLGIPLKPRTGGIHAPIDARGSKITVNTRLETDDPARFAQASLVGAFGAVAARPLSATFGLGAPPLANGAR